MIAKCHKFALAWLLLAALTLLAAGCNTMQGLGEDIENAGRGLQDAAE